ncbi:hypothetical protein LO771_09235 [Streptacidiphilus sp. ASG 303]|uniref:hypothetical protein n=1 Tax=Streptacidiphilus sp. ASG 303 TaxID=2896847 RepID=UPI001E64BA47|nr:hypothetical protein [Streptacidiphilus sp. ASG 303]MCD0482580.1 hypothetical protein [Streptacidiphilus sp. ASG 303]
MTFVPYVEALAFWGRAVQNGSAPRDYAIGVLLDHPLITDHSAGTPEQKADLVAGDLDAWEDRVVEMLWDPQADVDEGLRRSQGLPARPERPQRTSG